MSRKTAIILTIITSLCCALPGLFLCFNGTQMMLMSDNPSYQAGFEAGSDGMSPDIILPIGIGLVCTSLLLITIPVFVGFFSLRKVKANNAIEPY